MEHRLQKLIAEAGFASRRGAELMITKGEVTVDGKIVLELGTKVDPERHSIKVRGKLINPKLENQIKRYFLVNKPSGYLSSLKDPARRPLVIDLLPIQLRGGLHIVGRLDFKTEGLIILTNDGELTNLITTAGIVPKVYLVKVKGSPEREAIAELRSGVRLGKTSTLTAPALVSFSSRTARAGNSWFEVTLWEGKNQQIRRMFDLIAHPVLKLRRIRIAHLDETELLPGAFRELTPKEVAPFLKLLAEPGKQMPISTKRQVPGRKQIPEVPRTRAAKGRSGTIRAKRNADHRGQSAARPVNSSLPSHRKRPSK